MPFNRVIAVVTDDPSDIHIVARAADIVRDDRGHLYIIYVIKVKLIDLTYWITRCISIIFFV